MPDIIAAEDWRTLKWADSPPIFTPSAELFLHHGAGGSSSLSTLRAYERHHVLTNGWRGGLGYQYAIAGGQVYEGRGAGIQGAHIAGRNRVSQGIVICGDYSTRPPADRDIDALIWLIRHGHTQGWWRDRLTGGHRDAPGADTLCPGKALHRLIPAINRAAVGQPKEPDMSVSSWAKTAWNKARSRGIVTPDSSPNANVTAEQLMVFLDRAGLLDVDNATALEHATQLKRHMDEVDSNPGYVVGVVRHLRDHPSSGGISESHADGRYARLRHNHVASVELS